MMESILHLFVAEVLEIAMIFLVFSTHRNWEARR